MQGFPERLHAGCLLVPILLLALGAPGLAAAQDDDEDEEPGPFMAYLQERGNNAGIGLNGILTFPADPVMFAVEGPEVLDGWWAPPAHFVGFFAGLLQGSYRVVMGTLDIAFAPFPKFPMLGPVPRYKLLSFVQHDDE